MYDWMQRSIFFRLTSLQRRLTHGVHIRYSIACPRASTSALRPTINWTDRMSDIIDLTSDDEQHSIGASTKVNDDLKRAIAMSLQQNSLAEDDTLSDDDTDLKQAIAISLQGNTADDLKSSEPTASTTTGICGLDRKAMEAERLARLKRKRTDIESSSKTLRQSISPPPLRRQKMSEDDTVKTAASTSISSESKQISSTVPAKVKSASAISSSTAFEIPQVLLTSTPARYTGRSLQAISMNEIVKPPSAKHTLKSVLASSFIVDFDWLLPHFNTRNTNFLFVLHAPTPQHKLSLEQDFSGVPNVKILTPLCSGGNMHSKLMILFFKTANSDDEICRIVVPSANLTPADWGINRIMENVCFIADLKKSSGQGNHPFKQKLQQQLQAMEAPDNVVSKLDIFNFDSLHQTRFIFSMTSSKALDSGSQSTLTTKPSASTRVGMVALNDEIKSLGLSTNDQEHIQLDFVTSSLGNLTPQFVRQLHDAAAGQLQPNEIAKTAKATRGWSKPVTRDNEAVQNLQSNVRIYFPSHDTVQSSKGGISNAGTICFQRKWWDQNDLIRNCLHDCVGGRKDGILMHSKVSYISLPSFLNPYCSFSSSSGSSHHVWLCKHATTQFSKGLYGRNLILSISGHARSTRLPVMSFCFHSSWSEQSPMYRVSVPVNIPGNVKIVFGPKVKSINDLL